MARYLGRVARVMRLSGVDDQGCPGVRIDVDGGEFFWRVRDINIGDGRPSRTPAPRAGGAVPQACGVADANVEYGSIAVGARVVLGRHRPVGGDDAWSPRMSELVGRTARVVELAGVDPQGCPGVRVDLDGREFVWRVRDLTPVESVERVVELSPGLAEDHGRSVPAAEPSADTRLPQACGQTDATADFGPASPGVEVELARHRPVEGESNWVPQMNAYVGRATRVLRQVGVDEQGCPLVQVEIDNGDWQWRVRDLRLRAPP